jgi:hypothetical protein
MTDLPAASVFPNPVKDILHVEVPTRKAVAYRASDLLGREKHRGILRNGSGEFKVNSWQRGWYILQVEGYRPVRVLVGR